MTTGNQNLGDLQGRRMTEGNEPRPPTNLILEKPAAYHQAALQRIQEGGVATRVRILANHDSCPVCKTVEGAYEFDAVPELPLEGCSHPAGCRCVYEPVLDRRGP